MEENIFELTEIDWIKTKNANIDLIKANNIQIQMAYKVLELCEEQIKLCQIKTTLQEEEKNTKSATN